MNNFDKSSTGVDIEFSIFRDIDQARMLFGENIVKTDIKDLYFFTDCGQCNMPEIRDLFLLNDSKKLLSDYFKAYDVTGYSAIKYFLNYHGISCAGKIETVLDCIKYDLGESDSGLFDFLENHYPCAFEKLITRGYSQGDYAEVIVLCETIRNWSDKLDRIGDFIDHLFWDTPIWSRLTVNDNEYYTDEYSADNYYFDKAEFIDLCKINLSEKLEENTLKQVIGFLENECPEYPDYIIDFNITG